MPFAIESYPRSGVRHAPPSPPPAAFRTASSAAGMGFGALNLDGGLGDLISSVGRRGGFAGLGELSGLGDMTNVGSPIGNGKNGHDGRETVLMNAAWDELNKVSDGERAAWAAAAGVPYPVDTPQKRDELAKAIMAKDWIEENPYRHIAMSAYAGALEVSWQSLAARMGFCAAAGEPMSKNSLASDEVLQRATGITSSNGKYFFMFHMDGNLAIYGVRVGEPHLIWHAGAMNRGGTSFRLQGDGNLIVLNDAGKLAWASNRTWPTRGSYSLVMGDDGFVRIMENGQERWKAGGTDGGAVAAPVIGPEHPVDATQGGVRNAPKFASLRYMAESDDLSPSRVTDRFRQHWKEGAKFRGLLASIWSIKGYNKFLMPWRDDFLAAVLYNGGEIVMKSEYFDGLDRMARGVMDVAPYVFVAVAVAATPFVGPALLAVAGTVMSAAAAGTFATVVGGVIVSGITGLAVNQAMKGAQEAGIISKPPAVVAAEEKKKFDEAHTAYTPFAATPEGKAAAAAATDAASVADYNKKLATYNANLVTTSSALTSSGGSTVTIGGVTIDKKVLLLGGGAAAVVLVLLLM